MPDEHHGFPKGEGRKLRRARNALKRYEGKTENKLVARYRRAQAFLLAYKLRGE